ncbi:zinc finger protein on ecdysone puffs isoform X2 [Cephus cinctus]|uniref:Zinc finger protein on ecdysone puffs isoform X2 n=1 Tax=Cephus cinctus TaxID=211228 RepID=A0AAJ7BZN3_CEPCN|nr:zinc finger protein on ecdysone puffs isoform X2 [Cephus cinctus]
MSFNRGMKRDSFGNRNFNNRGGGGGGSGGGGGGGGGGGNMGGGGGGMSGGGGGGGGGMNPWESGMMPGRGILPTPNNNLSLASPQAQLAIASNLLTNLLRSQQDTQPQVPSLLSLGNNFGGPGPNFHGQQNYSPGRYNDRPMRHPMKNNRPQPYNKMGNNRARDGVVGRRGPSAQQSRAPQSGNQRMNGNQIQHRNDKSSKPIPASKQNQTAKKEQQDVKTSDNEKAETPVVKSEKGSNDAPEEKKAEVKEEKEEIAEATPAEKIEGEEEPKESAASEETEQTESTQQQTSSKEENEPVQDKDKEKDKDKDPKAYGKKSEARHAESRYAEVPMNRMFCPVCNKHMWDGYSFENHLRGRAHQLMMDKLDESYKLKVDLMRHELRVAEEQRELTLSNSKRRGKKLSVDLNVREYCTMCDLNFYGTLSSHRKSEKHQQLKTFLHPRCFPCVKEFPSRIEYDEHCLTPAHMKNAVQNEEQRKNKKKEKLAKGEAEVRTAEDEEKDIGVEPKTEKDEEPQPAENTVFLTDITDDITDTKYKVPSFKHCRQNQIAIGKSLVKEVQGYYCEKCRRFMMTSDDMTAHLRTITHYRNFVQEVKALTSTPGNATTKTLDESETNEKETQNENEEEEEEDGPGSCKRRKTSNSEENNEDVSETANETSNGSALAAKKSDGDEKYDPLEADAESEEDESNRLNPEQSQAEVQDAEINQEKNTPAEKMWADIDNDNEGEIGNLLDETGEEKDQQPEQEAEQTVAPPKVERNITPPQSKPQRGRGYPRGRGGRGRRSRR